MMPANRDPVRRDPVQHAEQMRPAAPASQKRVAFVPPPKMTKREEDLKRMHQRSKKRMPTSAERAQIDARKCKRARALQAKANNMGTVPAALHTSTAPAIPPSTTPRRQESR
jgi:guanylate kinase